MSSLKKLLFPFLFLLLVNSLLAQEFIGLREQNYAGVNSIDRQPASVVDSRFRFDANVFGGSNAGYTDLMEFKAGYQSLFRYWGRNHGFLANETMLDRSSDGYLHGSSELNISSFLLSFSETDAMGFSIRYRTIVNSYGLERDGLGKAYNAGLQERKADPFSVLEKISTGFGDTANISREDLTNEEFFYQRMVWTEYGGTYGRVLMDKDKDFLKAGVRVKFLQGNESEFLQMSDFRYSYTDSSGTGNFSSRVSAAQDRYEGMNGMGMDLGVVYEWRPDHEKYKYEMNGEKGHWRRDKEKYKLKLGASILDLGSISFQDANALEDQQVDITLDESNADSFSDTLNGTMEEGATSGEYRMALPTSISLQADYYFGKGLYLAGEAFLSFRNAGPESEKRVRYFTDYRLTPHFDHKWFGASLPISYSSLTGIRTGIAIRAGAFYVGSSDIRGFFQGATIRGLDGYIGVKVPIPYGGPEDEDKDKVSDDVDECPNVAGTWELKGCPDSDQDGIMDTNDDCPGRKGPASTDGCPDKDEDGIPDDKDDCPELAGDEWLNGCPDADKDSVMDSKDDCPRVKGKPELNGCPDADGDGIADINDNCPNEKGVPENSGCPKRARLHAVNRDAEVVATAYRNENGVFVFEKVEADEAHRYLLDAEDVDKDEIKIALQGKEGPREFYVRLTGSGFYYRYLPADLDPETYYKNVPDSSRLLYAVDSNGNVIGASYLYKDGFYRFEKLPADKPHRYVLDAEDTELKNELKVMLEGEEGPMEFVARMNKAGFYRTLPTDKKGLKMKDVTDESEVQLTKKQKDVVDKAFDDLHFDKGKATIKKESFSALNRLVDLLKDHPDWRIKLEGYTDSTGPKTRNLNLSRKRAQRVQRFLIQRGIPKERIIVRYFGEARPVADNSTKEGREKNRRVEMTIIE